MWRGLAAAVVAFAAASVALASAPVASSPTIPLWEPPVFGGKLPPKAVFTGELQTADLNGDGLRDVIVGPWTFQTIESVPLVLLLNKGGGRFEDATQRLYDGPPMTVEWNRHQVIADFNGDRRPDIFVADIGNDNIALNPGWPGQQNKLTLSTPDGRLRDATANLPQRYTFTHSAAAADVDGDGSIDIFENNFSCCGRSRRPPTILINDGTGRFREGPHRMEGLPVTQYGEAYSLACAFADVNRDGSPDLVLGANETTAASVVLLNDGRGNFDSRITLPPKLFTGSGIVMDIAGTDVNGDSALDLVLAETQNDPYYIGTRIQVLINDGRGQFTDETARRLADGTAANSWPNRVQIEDFDADGKPDLSIQTVGNWPADTEVPPVWLNRDGVFQRIAGPFPGNAAANNRGPTGFVNGAGPTALFSVQRYSPDNSGPEYYVSAQVVAPSAPTRVRAKAVRGGIALVWVAVPGATSYEVWRGTPRRRIASTPKTALIDATAPHRTKLTYTVRARNAAGVGPFSARAVGRRG